MERWSYYMRLLLLAGIWPTVQAQDSAAATITVGAVLLLIGMCVSICCLSGIGLMTLCRGSVRDYRPECDETRALGEVR